MAERKKKSKILFVCVGNSARSQMAEGFARFYGEQEYDAYSAGSKPEKEVNPNAIAAMKEAGIDISKNKPKSFSEVPKVKFDFVVKMGCKDVCPFFPAVREIEWKIEDPKGGGIEDFRKARDEIEAKVKYLLTFN